MARIDSVNFLKLKLIKIEVNGLKQFPVCRKDEVWKIQALGELVNEVTKSLILPEAFISN